MNTKLFAIALTLFLWTGCTNIKNEDTLTVEEEGTKPDNTILADTAENKKPQPQAHMLIGNWVGYFENADTSDDRWKKDVYFGNRDWNRENKINISMDRVSGDSIFGHSVVAGNETPFKGTILVGNTGITGKMYEPGSNKYDGVFSFSFKDSVLNGTWKAYKKIEITDRKYALKKKVFTYNPNQMLVYARRYADWNKEKKKYWEDEEGEWTSYFSMATNKIYKINASNTLLSKAEVSNLKKGDLRIIRNTIYARHGYSFKNRPLRVFFDAQSWYIPVYANIKKEFTDIEVKNIRLMLTYEKNAEEYYDYFGR